MDISLEESPKENFVEPWLRDVNFRLKNNLFIEDIRLEQGVPYESYDPTPEHHRHRLSDSLGCYSDESPTKLETPKTNNLFSPDACAGGFGKLNFSIGSSSPPPPVSRVNRGSSIVVDEDETSQDSGVCMEQGVVEEVPFKYPVAPPPRRVRTTSDSAQSPTKYPACVPDAMPLSFSKHLFADSPVKLKTSPLTSSQSDDDDDDGFLDLQYSDDEDKENSKPKGLDQLLSAPVLTYKDGDSITKSRNTLSDVTNYENKGSLRRGLFSQSASKGTRLAKAQSFCGLQRVTKRSEPCSEDATPRITKRRKSVMESDDKENCPAETSAATTAASTCFKTATRNSFQSDNIISSSSCGASAPRERPKLLRCQSDTEAIVKAALACRHAEHLIGDLTREYVLPTISGKHQDLKSISDATMSDLVNGCYQHLVEKYVIVDCRYPYEFDGGHIKGAKNIYTKDDLYDEFLRNAEDMPSESENEKRNILIFHCEFSSERAPKLSRFLRNQDRDLNKERYPNLLYPEMYLLDQGYKNFFSRQKQLCIPQSYRTMLDENHTDDLRKFRAKSKSWSGDRKVAKGRMSVRSGLKF